MAAAGIEGFATARELEYAPDGELRELTPALIAGSGGGVRELATGELAPGVRGTLCHHEFAAAGRRRESTIVLTEVPEIRAYAPALVCRDRKALGSEPAQLPVERWEPVELESSRFNDRYRLLVLAGQDAGFVRELFSPALIAWLADRAPDGLSFELNEGNVVVVLPGAIEDEGALAGLCGAAGELAGRLRAEALEEEADPDLFDESAELEALDHAVDQVRFDKPPESVGQAIERYREAAARKPATLLTALMWTAIAFAVVGGGVTAVLNPFAGALAGLFVAVPTFVLAQLLAASKYRWRGISVSRAGLERWAREYAASRDLELRDRWRFHSDHRALPLPGFADHVLHGRIPETDLHGDFVMLGNAAELRAQGTEMAYTSERPLAASALVVELEREPSAEALERVELPEDYSLEHAGRYIAVWRPVHGNLLRTSQGSDNFRRKAGEIAARAARAA